MGIHHIGVPKKKCNIPVILQINLTLIAKEYISAAITT
jgi:hypothetical protein